MPSLAQSLAGGTTDPQTAVNTANIASNTSSITALTARIDNRDQKDSVRLASLTNLALTGAAVVDGITPNNGDRIAALGQTTASQGGIYTYNSAGAWPRATDADTSAKVTAGMWFFVEEGTVSAGKAYELTTANPITLGTTALTFAHFAGSLKTSEIVNDSSVTGTTAKDALNTLQTKVGAANLAAYGALGPAATDVSDAINELASLTSSMGQLSFGRPNAALATMNFVGGASMGTVGTATARTPADTSYLTRRTRVAFVSAATASSNAGVNMYVAGVGFANRNTGFQFDQAMGLAAVTVDMKWFCGLYNTFANGIGQPSTILNAIGIGCDSTDTNLQLMTNDGSGTASKIDLGASFPPRTAGACYSVWLGCAPGGSTIYYRVKRLDVPAIATGSVSSKLPSAATLMFSLLMANNTSAAAIEVASFGFEAVTAY